MLKNPEEDVVEYLRPASPSNGISSAVNITIIAVVAFAVMYRAFASSSIYTCVADDIAYYINWVRQYEGCLVSGIIYPRWMSGSHSGFGCPTFVFYPPAVILLTALTDMISGDIVFSANFVKFLGLFLSGLFMYVFAKGLWGPRAGLVAALVYMLLPPRLFDLDFRGVYASKFAYALFPLLLHLTRKTAVHERFGADGVYLGAVYGLLCVTHLLSAYMVAPVLLAFGLVTAGRTKAAGAALRLSISGLLGLGLAAFYLLPALAEKGLVHFEMLLTDEIYRYENNFVFYVPGPASSFNREFYRFLSPAVLSSALLVFSMYLYAMPSGDTGKRREAVFFIGASIFCLFMMSSLSAPLWASVPGMHILQFPNRWVSILCLCLASVFGAAASPKYKSAPAKQALAVLTGIVVLGSAALTFYYDFVLFSKSCSYTRQDIDELPRDMDVLEYVPKDVSLAWLKDCRVSQKIPAAESLYPEIPVTINIKRRGSRERLFSIEARSDTVISIRTFYYPGWKAYIDGAQAGIEVQPVTDAMLVSVPAGKHELLLKFEDSPDRLAGWAVSALACLLAAALLSQGFRKSSGMGA